MLKITAARTRTHTHTVVSLWPSKCLNALHSNVKAIGEAGSCLIHLCCSLLSRATRLAKNASMWQMALVSNLCHRLSWHLKEKNAPQLPLDELNESEPLSSSQRHRTWRHRGCLWNLSRCGASAQRLKTPRVEVDAEGRRKSKRRVVGGVVFF